MKQQLLQVDTHHQNREAGRFKASVMCSWCSLSFWKPECTLAESYSGTLAYCRIMIFFFV